jgi:hypothetical protein
MGNHCCTRAHADSPNRPPSEHDQGQSGSSTGRSTSWFERRMQRRAARRDTAENHRRSSRGASEWDGSDAQGASAHDEVAENPNLAALHSLALRLRGDRRQGVDTDDEIIRGFEAFVRVLLAGDANAGGARQGSPASLLLAGARRGDDAYDRMRSDQLDNYSYLQVMSPRHMSSETQDDAATTRDQCLLDESYVVCAICMSEFAPGDTLRVLPCLHRFHKGCVDQWLCEARAACPICRENPRHLVDRPLPAEFSTAVTSPDEAGPSPILIDIGRLAEMHTSEPTDVRRDRLDSSSAASGECPPVSVESVGVMPPLD